MKVRTVGTKLYDYDIMQRKQDIEVLKRERHLDALSKHADNIQRTIDKLRAPPRRLRA